MRWLEFLRQASQLTDLNAAESVTQTSNRRRHSTSDELSNSIAKFAEIRRNNSLSITEEGDDHNEDSNENDEDEKMVREPFKEKILNTKLNEENGDKVPKDKLMMRRQSQAPPLMPHE